jgi:DNA-binding IclR family transcriptional regulator
VVESSVSGVGVLDKGLVVLRAVSERPTDLAGLQDATGLPRATAHRLAVALERHGLLRRDDAGRFCLGFELIRLGRLATEAFPLGDVARPVLQSLRDDLGESVQLYVREGEHRRCVESLESTHGLRWIVPRGALLPLDRGSAGIVLLGESALAESVEAREPGVASVSAAVTDGAAQLLAAVSVSGPVERLSRSPLDKYGDVLAAAAGEIERRVKATAGRRA